MADMIKQYRQKQHQCHTPDNGILWVRKDRSDKKFRPDNAKDFKTVVFVAVLVSLAMMRIDDMCCILFR